MTPMSWMYWQETGVVLVVAGAVYYIVRKIFGRPGSKKPATFVPLSSLKKRR